MTGFEKILLFYSKPALTGNSLYITLVCNFESKYENQSVPTQVEQ